MTPFQASGKRVYPLVGVLVCTLVVVATNGMTSAGLTVFDEALLTEFEWSVGELKIRDSITFFGAAALIILSGAAVDRFGFKAPLILGLATLACAYLGYSFVQTLPQIYGIHVLIAIVLACAGNMVAVIAAVSTMPERRGLAVGMTVAGSSVGGIILPPLASWLNESFGWREAMRIEALIPIAVLVIVALMLKNRVPAKKTEKAEAASDGVSYTEAIRCSQFYFLALAGGFCFYSAIAFFAHLFLYMRTLEFSAQSASLGLSLFSLSALVVKLASGWVADKVGPFILLRLHMAAMLTGLLGALFLPDLIWLFIVVTGLGWGGLHTLLNFSFIAIFGLRAAGKINATASIVQSAGAGIGAAATGFLFDYRGDYSLAFLVVALLVGASLVLSFGVRPLHDQAVKPPVS